MYPKESIKDLIDCGLTYDEALEQVKKEADKKKINQAKNIKLINDFKLRKPHIFDKYKGFTNGR